MNNARLILRLVSKIKTHRSLSSSCNNDFVIKSSLPDVVLPNMRFSDRLWINAAKFQNLVAVECAETKKTYTYHQLLNNIDVYATSLHHKLGLKPGDVVAVMLPNCPEFVVVAFGTLRAGCVASPINPIYKEYEISHQVSITQPKVIITSKQSYDSVRKGLASAKSKAKIVIIDKPNEPIPEGAIRFTELAETGKADNKMLDNIEQNPDSIAFIPFSSGTTGLPKGVNISFRNLVASAEIMARKENCYANLSEGGFQDIVPCVLPFFHIYGLVVTLIGHLAQGCKLVTLPNFSASLYLDVLKSQKSTLLYVVPPMAILLGKHPDVTASHLKHVRTIVCGAAPLSSSDVDAIFEKSNANLNFCQGYGATETTSLTTATFLGAPNVDYSSCGNVLASTQLKFVDPLTGNPVPVGQQGELYVRGPTNMMGYHKNEEATKESLTEDGYFKTGDLGYYKPGVGLYITDRIKELIKVKGMQVAPAELESLLRTHPAVQEAAVIGIPHEFFGEVPKAFVIPKAGKKLNEDELKGFIAENVASFKRIEKFQFVDNIPKTSSGKILRRDLKKMNA